MEKCNQEYNSRIEQEIMKLDLSKPRLMAILNLTPDSFSDGGKWGKPEQIVEGVGTMIGQGADIIDIGVNRRAPVRNGSVPQSRRRAWWISSRQYRNVIPIR